MQIAEVNDTAALEEALLHEQPHVRATARAVASGWPRQLQEWMKAEIEREVDDNANIMPVLMSLTTDVMASYLASVTQRDGDAEITRHMIEGFRRELPKRLASIRAHLDQRREGSA